MTKTIDVDISVREILNIILQRRKLILIIAVVCAVLGGAYGMLKAQYESDGIKPMTEKQQTQYEEDMADFEAYQESREVVPRVIKSEWVSLYRDMKDNPIYDVDPQHCEYEQIVIHFEGGGNYDKTLSNWIAGANDNKLFGDSADILSKYKSSIVFSENYPLQQETDETTVQIIAVDNFDSAEAAKYLVQYFKSKASSEDMTIEQISTEHMTGYNKNLAEYQKNSRDAIVSTYNSLNSVSNLKGVFAEPSAQQTSTPSTGKKTMKYGMAGLILGLILGIGLAVFSVLRSGCIVSPRQVEELFELELLSDFSHGSEAARDVLDANLDVMAGEGSDIAIVADACDDIDRYAEEWNADDGRRYIPVKSIFDDPEGIEKLNNAEGIVICVSIGESKLANIQRIILRTDKLKKPVLGYVLI